jgi:pyruvate/2-oxoglutarate dehydrogenase complex dihydrolipoamide acyltransferase (E2) component
MSEVDLTEIELLRAGAASRGWIKPSYTAVVAKALALTLRDFPYANRRLLPRLLPFRGARLQQFHDCDVAVACERDEPGAEVATFVDVLRGADRLPLEAIGSWLRRLSASTEDTNEQWHSYRRVVRRLPRWLAKLVVRLPVFLPSLWVRYRGAAAMISSPAKYGVDAVIGTWTSPLGVSFGLVRQRAVVRDDKVVARPTFLLTLNFDRRVMAGAQAARFFHEIVRRLEAADLGETVTAGSPAPAFCAVGERR